MSKTIELKKVRTGTGPQARANTDWKKYRENYDRIFRKKESQKNDRPEGTGTK